MLSKYEHYHGSTEYQIPKTMQALVSEGRGFKNLFVREVPVPQIGPDQLLARVDAAGVCTSILKLIDQGPDHTFLNGWDMSRWPIILGDEGAVTIVQVGENLKETYQPGQHFAVQPAVDVPPVLHRERYNNEGAGMTKCAVGYTLGGNLAQYICIQEEVLQGQCLVPLPNDQLPYFAVSMAEPISCVYSAQQRNYHLLKPSPHAARVPKLGLLPGGISIVIGAGAMGRMHAELALRFQPAVLIVSDLQQERLDNVTRSLQDKAKQKGTRLLCVLSDKLESVLKDVSQGRGADDIIMAVGIQPVQQHALSLLADGGAANFFGGLPKGKHLLELDALAVHYREIKYVGSSGGDPSDMVDTLKAFAEQEIDPGNYVAAVGSLDNAIDVLKMITETQIDGKAILYPHIGTSPLQRVDYWDKNKETELLNDRLL